MRDHTKYSFYLSLMVLLGLLAISRIPAFTVEGIKFKRANIISDLYRYDDETAADGEAELSRDDLDFIREMQDASNYATEGEGTEGGADEVPVPDNQPGQQTWDFGTAGTDNSGGEATTIELDGTTVIEDYSPDKAMHRFGSLLGTATQSRNVRIAFLGDSFIEGDIITADVREQLQGRYGGQGVGFVALSSITAEYRPTVKHTFRGWKDYLLANKRNVPEEFSDRFYISGIISAANAAAWSQYETTTYRKYIGEVSTVRFFYSSAAPGDITFKVNDTHERSFPADSSGAVQQINISGGGITQVRVSVPATEGFAGYGVSLEGRSGVLVDNYSIRSSTGLSLFGTSSAVNSSFNRILGYDLIVLQYGLNIMSAEVTGYSSYGEQFRNLVYYIKRCFPSAAIVVMGVGDRSMQSNGEFVTMPAVPAMIREQRAIAQDCGVAFWNTYVAMGGYNSMKRFAEWGWAAKDYTHLSFSGGRKIATEFVKAVEYARLYPWYADGEEPEEEEPADSIHYTVPVIPPMFDTETVPQEETPISEPRPEEDEAADWVFGREDNEGEQEGEAANIPADSTGTSDGEPSDGGEHEENTGEPEGVELPEETPQGDTTGNGGDDTGPDTDDEPEGSQTADDADAGPAEDSKPDSDPEIGTENETGLSGAGLLGDTRKADSQNFALHETGTAEVRREYITQGQR